MAPATDTDTSRWLRVALSSVALLVAATALTGCVERYLLVRSDPPGATVFVDGELAGNAPVAHPFTFYGRTEIVARHPGHLSTRTVETVLPVCAEYLGPWTLRDERVGDVTLSPAPRDLDSATRAAAADRARALGERGRQLTDDEPAPSAPEAD